MTKALEQTTLATEEHSYISSDESTASYQNSSPLPQLLSEVAQALPDLSDLPDDLLPTFNHDPSTAKKLSLIQLAILVF